MAGCKFLCSSLLTMVFLAGAILFLLWLSADKHRPVFHLADFSIPNASRGSGLAKLPVRFTVTAHNPNRAIGIYYREVSASVYYGDQVIASGPVARPSFYQAPKRDTPVEGPLTASGPTPADPAWEWFADEISAGSVAMRLLLHSTVRFRWYAKKHHLAAECSFRIDGNGTLQQQDKDSRCVLGSRK